ncbi:MAG TPA: hypothetical protein VFH45_12870 [Acidimicrobiales bacterium]|nr:hypothetical protein [Acidimicrobiales bacterium]
MRALRRAGASLAVAAVIASVLRPWIKRSQTEPDEGGWRELAGPDLR